jgi:catechol 2,3-dioxygenase-like lactoylglutathione lyase family enzyme
LGLLLQLRIAAWLPLLDRKPGYKMIDHTGFAVSDLIKSKAFYSAALKPLGIELVMEVTAEQTGAGAHAGYGSADKPFFWIGDHGSPCPGVHIAFAAESRMQVEQFYRAALHAGGKDNGAPGLRPHYHANYYGAFVFDPDGNNIEAVCHKSA